MGPHRSDKDTATILKRVFNGRREPFPPEESIIYRVFDGNQKKQREKELNASAVRFPDLPVFSNFGDNYRVIVSADGYEDAGLYPVKVAAGKEIRIELMLVPKHGVFKFANAQFGGLAAIDPEVPGILSSDLGSSDAAAQRWSDKFENDSPAAACLLNILSVMANSSIAAGRQLLGFLKQAIFDDRMKRDHFFGWADRSLIDQLKLPPETSGQVRFEPADSSLHPGATRSFKAKQYSEANLQLTFHENETPPSGHPDWVLVEPDIDYYDDKLSHFFLEVIPNELGNNKTDPAHVLALRWMAERRAGKDFNPLYTVEPA